MPNPKHVPPLKAINYHCLSCPLFIFLCSDSRGPVLTWRQTFARQELSSFAALSFRRVSRLLCGNRSISTAEPFWPLLVFCAAMLQTQRRGCSVSLANIDTARATDVTLTHTLVHKHNVQHMCKHVNVCSRMRMFTYSYSMLCSILTWSIIMAFRFDMCYKCVDGTSGI